MRALDERERTASYWEMLLQMGRSARVGHGQAAGPDTRALRGDAAALGSWPGSSAPGASASDSPSDRGRRRAGARQLSSTQQERAGRARNARSACEERPLPFLSDAQRPRRWLQGRGTGQRAGPRSTKKTPSGNVVEQLGSRLEAPRRVLPDSTRAGQSQQAARRLGAGALTICADLALATQEAASAGAAGCVGRASSDLSGGKSAGRPAIRAGLPVPAPADRAGGAHPDHAASLRRQGSTGQLLHRLGQEDLPAMADGQEACQPIEGSAR